MLMTMETAQQINLFKEFFEKYYLLDISKIAAEGGTRLTIDFSILPVELKNEILDYPKGTLKAGEIAISMFDRLEGREIKLRLKNVPANAALKIRDKRAEHINKLFVFNGIVRIKTDIYPNTVMARFECPLCAKIIPIVQTDNFFKEPQSCSCGRKGKFRLVSATKIDTQVLTLEEPPDELEGNEQPRRMKVILEKDLCSKFTDGITNPGARIKVIGTLNEQAIFQGNNKLTRSDYIVNTNSIETNEESFFDLSVSDEEKKKIIEFSKRIDLYEVLINSVAPDISGHATIKEAILLQLFGGVRKQKKSKVWSRGDMHILLVGDPGSGKSQLLRRVAIVAPKSRLVTGKSASGAGLTAIATKDDITKAWALEAGALVLANKGMCLIDEMDKMNKEDSSAMHEALEQQTVTKTVANINATLRAECSVLAAANPTFSRFDRNESISKQIDMPLTLLNRFDFIFPVIDWVDEVKDRQIAQSIFGNLKEEFEQVDTDFLRKYIAYAKRNIQPKLSDESTQVLEDFYIDMRKKSSNHSIAISPRQCEALVRATESSAKIRLASVTTREDAERAIKLLKYCLKEVGFDVTTGNFDIDIIEVGVPASRTGKMKRVTQIIYEEMKGKETGSIKEIEKKATDIDIPLEIVDETIEKLKLKGEIFEPRKGELCRLGGR